MIKVYVMQTCPACTAVKQQLKDDPHFLLTDIGEQARNLKQFLSLRDNNPAFERVRQRGTIGIPCFVFEDGSIVFSLEKAMEIIKDMPQILPEEEPEEGASCSIDGKGC